MYLLLSQVSGVPGAGEAAEAEDAMRRCRARFAEFRCILIERHDAEQHIHGKLRWLKQKRRCGAIWFNCPKDRFEYCKRMSYHRGAHTWCLPKRLTPRTRRG